MASFSLKQNSLQVGFDPKSPFCKLCYKLYLKQEGVSQKGMAKYTGADTTVTVSTEVCPEEES